MTDGAKTAKLFPESRADLYRMLQTSDGWFDGQIAYEQVRDPHAPYEVGQVDCESVHVSASPYQGCDVEVYRNRHVVSEVRGKRSCSLRVERMWTERMSFDEFRMSEWWAQTIGKFGGGDCDASEIFVRCDDSDCCDGPNSYVHVSAQCERHWRDWLGNGRLAKGHDDVMLWLQGNGDVGFILNGTAYEMTVGELAECIEQARAFAAAGVEIEDGRLTAMVGGKDGDE